MLNALILSYYVIGIILWKYKKEYLPIYQMYLITFGLLPKEIIAPSLETEDLWNSFAQITNVSVFLAFIGTVLNLVFFRQNINLFISKNIKYMLWVLGATIYFFTWQSIHNRTSGGGITFLYVQVTSLFLYYQTIPYQINPKILRKHFIIIFCLECIFVLISLFIGPLYISQQFEILKGEPFLISGTFYRYNYLASFTAISGIIISFAYFYHEIKFYFYFILILIITYLTIQTGARMQLVWLIITILLLAISKFKENQKLCIFLFTSGIICYITLKSIDLGGLKTTNAENGIERQFYGIVSAINGSSTESGDQTQDISSYIVSHYFFKAPLIGNALGDKVYSYHPNITNQLMMADAPQAFVLVEYGILGIIFTYGIILSAFGITIKKMKKDNKKKILVLIISLFILSITESGFFDNSLMIYLWNYIAWLKYSETNSLPLCLK